MLKLIKIKPAFEIQDLPDVFEKRGFVYQQLKSENGACIFSVVDNKTNQVYGYEVFKRILTNLCTFDQKNNKRVPLENQYKIRYPNDESFGKWAWFYNDLNLAAKKFAEIQS